MVLTLIWLVSQKSPSISLSMMKIIVSLFFVLMLSSCSSYKVKVGKKCIDNENGGQSWSRIWFVQKDVEFTQCEQ